MIHNVVLVLAGLAAGTGMVEIVHAQTKGTALNLAQLESILTSWLIKKVTVEEIEAANPGIRDERINRFPEAAKPFGFLNPKWEALKAEMKPGDELWTFASPADSWKNLAGRAGIALVREGDVVRSIITLQN